MGVSLNREGFITKYLISGPVEEPFVDVTGKTDQNQLRYEAYLRSILPRECGDYPEEDIRLGKKGPESGSIWSYYFSYGDWFVDFSRFYSALTRVELSAAVVLKAKRDTKVKAVCWSYANIRVWCGGELAGEIERPVYKPITKKEMTFRLKEGENLIYIKLQNLGVRDTRTIFGLQLTEGASQVEVLLPDMEGAAPYLEADEFLSGIKKQGETLVFSVPAPEGTTVTFTGKESVTVPLEGASQVDLKKGMPNLLFACPVGESRLTRRFENLEMILPAPPRGLSLEENQRQTYAEVAGRPGTAEDGSFNSMMRILARKAMGQERPDDPENIRKCLAPVKSRHDCSDFTVSALLRYLENYPVDEELEEEIKDTLLNYRYWMDQKGSDGMCFWSENHAILFYSSAMLAGERYPLDTFTASGMKGRELGQVGKQRVEQWLSCVEEYGFEEFLSSGYMCVTFAALLNVIDYGEMELAKRAALAADKLLRMLAVQTFRGTVIAPMGRVYRGVLYPFMQPTQILMNLFNPNIPCVEHTEEGWAAFYATSSYQPPLDLISLMEEECSREYSTGNALIRLEKRKDYCLTSVQSPREDGFVRWENLTLKGDGDGKTHAYTRSLNERFHGTTCFEPGVYGYQQHMWYGAVDNDTFVFTSHPGGTCDASGMRPGYWYGNGVVPALKQDKNRLGLIYEIPGEHPIRFTHLFFPTPRFDWARQEGSWLFGGKKEGYVGVWCSQIPEAFSDQLFDCEFRIYKDKCAYFCVMGSREEYGSREAFMEACRKMEPVYEEEEGCLKAAGDFFVRYVRREDKTQYI